MKRITKKAWFGKKIFGRGYRPISLEGWVVTIVFIITMIADIIYNKRSATGYAILAALLIILLPEFPYFKRIYIAPLYYHVR